MSNSTGPLYETTYVVATDAREAFDSWIREFQQRSLSQTGIEEARGYETDPEDDGYFRVVFRYRATDDPTMDALLDGFFTDADGELAERFGDTVTTESRVLREDDSRDVTTLDNPNCLNCGTRLGGQYCGKCGQRSRSRLISIWQLLQEAFGDLLELDSRLWRTVLPLLIRPGQLTKDYLEGRRARYMPPFRTYLVLSVIFFVVAFFDPKEDLSFFFEPEPPPTAEEIAEQEEDAKRAAAEEQEHLGMALEKLQTLEAEGKIDHSVVQEFEDNQNDFVISFGGDDDENDEGIFGDCENVNLSNEEDMPEWVTKRFTDERVKQICERNKARGNDNFVDAILDNIPVALIVLLPIMAMVLKVLYPLSRRYFVEHLLFFVHFHAFFFLILILQILFARLAGLLGPEDGAIDTIGTLILVATSFYIPVYLYKAMRLVYGQGHLATQPKYFILSVAYVAGAALTMVGAFLVALLSA
ncbi:MAG: DUF4286 family protein [Gammaproteobacteria bacterium]|jgi:hypothetical protein|nr:DUF4286 family protein [Gammaproteobacteria bacterium]